MSLLTLRKLLNSLQGVHEDYLDKLTACEEFYSVSPEDLQVSDMLSFSYDKTLIAKLSVDELKCQTLLGMVTKSFTKVAKICQSHPKSLELAKQVHTLQPDGVSLLAERATLSHTTVETSRAYLN